MARSPAPQSQIGGPPGPRDWGHENRQANYAATKAAVGGFSRALAKELGSRNITVNAVAPGFIETDMTKDLPENLKDSMLAQVPLGRLGQPEEIAEIVAFLADDGGAYITGETIHANGGMYMS